MEMRSRSLSSKVWKLHPVRKSVCLLASKDSAWQICLNYPLADSSKPNYKKENNKSLKPNRSTIFKSSRSNNSNNKSQHQEVTSGNVLAVTPLIPISSKKALLANSLWTNV